MKKHFDNPHFAAYYRWLVLTQCLHLQTEDKDALLDIGCDDGFFLFQQKARLKVGVDLLPRISPNNTLCVVRANGCELPFADQSFSVVFAFDLIEHVPNGVSLINSITRILAKGGTLWLSTPANKPYFPVARLTRWIMNRWGHERFGYDPAEIFEILTQQNYDVQTLLCWNSLCFRILYLPLWFLSRISPGFARLGARICFEIDKHLKGCDHIFLKAVHRL